MRLSLNGFLFGPTKFGASEIFFYPVAILGSQLSFSNDRFLVIINDFQNEKGHKAINRKSDTICGQDSCAGKFLYIASKNLI